MMLIIFCDNNEDLDYDDVDDHAHHYYDDYYDDVDDLVHHYYDDYDNISQRRSLQRTAMCKTPSSSLSSSKPGFLSLCFVVCVVFVFVFVSSSQPGL